MRYICMAFSKLLPSVSRHLIRANSCASTVRCRRAASRRWQQAKEATTEGYKKIVGGALMVCKALWPQCSLHASRSHQAHHPTLGHFWHGSCLRQLSMMICDLRLRAVQAQCRAEAQEPCPRAILVCSVALASGALHTPGIFREACPDQQAEIHLLLGALHAGKLITSQPTTGISSCGCTCARACAACSCRLLCVTANLRRRQKLLWHWHPQSDLLLLLPVLLSRTSCMPAAVQQSTGLANFPTLLSPSKECMGAESGLVLPPAHLAPTVVAAALLQFLRTLEEPLLTHK